MPYYTHKSLPVFAMQHTGDNAEEIAREFAIKTRIVTTDGNLPLSIEFMMGKNRITKFCLMNQYILCDHIGAINVMSKEEFEEQYAPQTPSPL